MSQLEIFASRLEAYSERYAAYRRRGVSEEISPQEDMLEPDADGALSHYFQVGRDAIRVILGALLTSGRDVPARILDMPCGFGRVTRHLGAFFPESEIVACDLYPDRVRFCEQVFGVEGVLSEEELSRLDLGGPFDLIWCGSLLTHLPERLFQDCLQLFIRSLSATGIAVVTLHGRYSVFVQHNRWEYMPPGRFAKAERGFAKSGFGYADYEMGKAFDRQRQYGISLTAPSYLTDLLEKEEGIRLLGYSERDWDDHQDVVVFGPPPLST